VSPDQQGYIVYSQELAIDNYRDLLATSKSVHGRIRVKLGARSRLL